MAPSQEKEQPKKVLEDGFVYFLCSLVVFAIDQITKNAVVSMMHLQDSIPVIPGFFHLTFIMNTGASFGILQDMPTLFVVVSSLVIVAMCWIVFFWREVGLGVKCLLGIISGGALGNLCDRLQFNAVVDFIDFRGVWPYIFNIADMAVVCGSLALAFAITRDEWKTWFRKPKH